MYKLPQNMDMRFVPRCLASWLSRVGLLPPDKGRFQGLPEHIILDHELPDLLFQCFDRLFFRCLFVLGATTQVECPPNFGPDLC